MTQQKHKYTTLIDLREVPAEINKETKTIIIQEKILRERHIASSTHNDFSFRIRGKKQLKTLYWCGAAYEDESMMEGRIGTKHTDGIWTLIILDHYDTKEWLEKK